MEDRAVIVMGAARVKVVCSCPTSRWISFGVTMKSGKLGVNVRFYAQGKSTVIAIGRV